MITGRYRYSRHPQRQLIKRHDILARKSCGGPHFLDRQRHDKKILNMKDLPFSGAYALLGVLLLGSPLIDSGQLFSSLTAQKVFWIQLIALFLAITCLLSLLFHKGRIFHAWTWIDTLPIVCFVWILLSYPYPIDAEPEKILFIGQVIVL